MVVMSEEDDLRPGGQFVQDREGGRGAFVIETQQHVIHDEWDGAVRTEVMIETGHTKRQVELIARAVAHSRDFEGPSVLTRSDQHALSLDPLPPPAREAAAGQNGE